MHCVYLRVSFPTPHGPSPWVPPGYVNSHLKRQISNKCLNAWHQSENGSIHRGRTPDLSPGSVICFFNMRTYIFIKLLTFRSIFTFTICVHFSLVSEMLSAMKCFVQRMGNLWESYTLLTQQSYTGRLTGGKKEPV